MHFQKPKAVITYNCKWFFVVLFFQTCISSIFLVFNRGFNIC